MPRKKKKIQIGFSLAVACLTYNTSCALMTHPVDKADIVRFYPTVGSFNNQSGMWELPIHVHVFEPKEDSAIRSAVGGMFKSMLDVDASNSAIFTKRIRLFLSDNHRWKDVQIKIAGETFHLASKTSANGHLQETIKISDQKMNQ